MSDTTPATPTTTGTEVAVPPRCGTCLGCTHVELSKPLFAPNPPFTHAATADAVAWNQTLYDNPCGLWDAAQTRAYRVGLRRSVRPSVRPKGAP